MPPGASSFYGKLGLNSALQIIKASELGSFLYCQRAWWYQRQGIASENTAALANGEFQHSQHAFNAKISILLKWLALGLLLIALALIFVSLLR